MLRRSTIQLLRFPFSLFLLPVFLFALSESEHLDTHIAWIIFAILHLLVYPASNGYNSYMDRDETPIGGLERPPAPSRELFVVTIVMDATALLLSYFLVSPFFTAGVAVYIIASRAYSYRGIRLKRFPVAGFLTVFIFQGAWIYWIVARTTDGHYGMDPQLLPALASSCLIGALYPLTQVYQHEADIADGVVTISYRLGKRGSFLFSGLLFGVATALLYATYAAEGSGSFILAFLVFTLPVVIYFLYWMLKVWKNEAAADFKHSLRMNIIASVCMTLYFFILTLPNFS
ncbi:UbiA family prenyltransferase [Flaviaesturariibacter aridisoli]|nr:UbiA family prenyltransferase [Flaviaesturariibacter aridisoli]